MSKYHADRAFTILMITALTRGAWDERWVSISSTDTPCILPQYGISLAAVEQQTASGLRSTGVKQIPPYPELSFTPVKNTPTTTDSSRISEKGTGILVFRISIVSERMAFCFSAV